MADDQWRVLIAIDRTAVVQAEVVQAEIGMADIGQTDVDQAPYFRLTPFRRIMPSGDGLKPCTLVLATNSHGW